MVKTSGSGEVNANKQLLDTISELAGKQTSRLTVWVANNIKKDASEIQGHLQVGFDQLVLDVLDTL